MFKIFAVLGTLALAVLFIENWDAVTWQGKHGLGWGLVALALVVVLIAIIIAVIVAATQTI